MGENQVGFMGAPIPRNFGSNPTSHIDYFQQYRNESISRMQVSTVFTRIQSLKLNLFIFQFKNLF